MIAIPYTNPVRFRGVDYFDFDRYVKSCCYFQKWQKGDTIYMQFLADENVQIKIIDIETGLTKATVNTIVQETNLIGQNFEVREAVIDLSILTYGLYYFSITDGEGASVISYPIDYKEKHENTILIRYWNSENDLDTIFETGVQFEIRVEGTIRNYTPKTDTEVYFNQRKDPTLLYALPYRSFTLQIGRAAGVSEWIADVLNVAFACDQKTIDGVFFERNEGAEWEVTRLDNYELIGMTLEILPLENQTKGYIKGNFVLGDSDGFAVGLDNKLIITN